MILPTLPQRRVDSTSEPVSGAQKSSLTHILPLDDLAHFLFLNKSMNHRDALSYQDVSRS